MKKVTILMFIALLALSSLYSKTIYVSLSGANTNGSSWQTAYNQLQTAIDSAKSGDEIWVAQGTYYPTNNPKGTNSNMDIAFQMKKGVAIYGGFGGFENDLSERNKNNYKVILSADIGVHGQTSDNCNNIFYNPKELLLDETSILDGFELSEAQSSAISNTNANPILRNIIFRNNYGTSGSAIYNNSNRLTIENCNFYDNQNTAIYNDTADLKLLNCEFKRIELSEQANVQAMYNESSNVTIDTCKFYKLNNIGKLGALISYNSTLKITNSNFTDNKLLKNGDLFTLYETSVLFNNKTNCNINRCKFDSNYSAYGSGAIYEMVSSSSYRNCTFTNNRTDSSGGVFGIFNNSNVSIINSEFYRNRAEGKGGTIYTYSNSNNLLAYLTITNCTIADNFAGQSGAIHFESKNAKSRMYIRNSIIWRNSSAIEPLDINVFNVRDTLFIDNSCFNLSYSNISGMYIKNKCVHVNPLFANRGAYPYCVTMKSACTDAGSNSFIDEIRDIRGEEFSRTMTYDGIIDGIVDMGAYEYKHGTDIESNNIIIYVNKSAVGANDGSSWQDAFVNLQDAFDKAIYRDEIWVAQAKYYPTKKIGGQTERHKAFAMQAGVKIYGGFIGNETQVSQAKPEINITTLSGNIGDESVKTDNCFHVFNHSELLSLDSNAQLNGFDICDGYCIGEYNNSSGAAMINITNSPRLINCCFHSNTATEGGAIANFNSSITAENCTFNNSASDGANICNYNESKPIFNNCKFSSSTAENFGGAFYNSHSTIKINNCIFDSLKAKFGAAIYNFDNSVININNSIFTNCYAINNGGAISNITGTANFYNSKIMNNYAFYGSAVYNFGGLIKVINSIIAKDISESGNVFNDNNGTIEFTNCTIADNQANQICGGIFNNRGEISVRNSILWNNYNLSVATAKQIFNKDGNFVLVKSCFPNNSDDIQGEYTSTYCINESPQLTGTNQYTIYGTSPCVDAGYDVFIDEEYDNRGVGFPRKMAKDGSVSGTVDIGAIEYQNGIDPAIGAVVEYSNNNYQISINPNPVSDNCEICFTLINEQNLDLFICDLLGNRVKTLSENELFNSGNHKLKINNQDLLNGTYYLILKSNSKGSIIKFVVNK